MSNLIATTHYGDYKGTVSLDKDDLKDPFLALAKDNGVDLKGSYLVAIEFNKTKAFQEIVFITTDIGLTYDEIATYLKSNENLPCKYTRISMDINNFLKYTKQFSFTLVHNEEFLQQSICEGC